LQWATEKKERGAIKEPAVIGAVIEHMHTKILEQAKIDMAEKGYSQYKIFDSIRGVFIEGGPSF